MASQVKIGIGVDDSQFKQGLNQCTSAANSFGKSLNGASQKSQTFAGQMRAARKHALELAQAYDQLDQTARNSDFGRSLKAQLDEALQTAGRLTDLKSDVMEEIKNIASDTQMWDGAKQGIGIVSSGLQGFASLYGLTGKSTEEFTKALVAVNAVQSAANSIISIGNALQKQSAVMVMLRTMRSKLFTTATAAETAAISTNTAATGAQTVATEAATTAQIANNLAVLSNPYIACAAAIAALVAGLYLWANANDDVSESERIKSEALQAMSEQLEKTSDEVGKQISAFMVLQHEYQKADGDLDTMKRNMSNFDEVCKAANITLKKQSDTEIVLGKLAPVMIKKYQAEARAAAASAAMAAEYGKILAKVADIQKRIAQGETIDMGDLEKLNINPQQVKNMFKQEAGLDDLFASVFQPSAQDLKYIGKDLEKDMQDLAEKAFGAFNEKASVFTTTLDNSYKEIAGYLDELKTAGVDTNALFGDDKVKKATSKAAKHVKSTSKEMNVLLSTLEGCDNVIKKATTDITKLDHNADDFAKKFIALNATILKAKQSKFELLDKSTLQGMNDARKLAQEIVQSLEQGSDEYKQWQKNIDDLNESMYNYYSTMSKSGSTKTLSDTKSFIEDIIKDLPAGSDELNEWVKRYREVKHLLEDINERNNNLMNGIEQGSETQINQLISKLKTRLQNENMSIFDRTEIEEEIAHLERQLANMNIDFTIATQKPIEVTFDYKKTPLEKMQRDLEHVQQRVDYLRETINDNDTPEWGIETAREELESLMPVLNELKKKAKLTELGEDIKQYAADAREAGYKTFQGFTDGLHTLYNVMSELPNRLDEAKNGFEGFFEVLEAGFSIVDSIVSFIDTIKKMSEVVTLLTGAKAAHAAVTESETSNLVSNTAAMVANATASTAAATAKATEAAAGFTNAGANAAEAVTETASQNAKMGPWGWVAAIAAAAAMGALLFSMIGRAKGYANGGIITGSHTMGDQLLVRANAGEMIINKRQQANLFDLLNSGANETSSNAPTTTTFRIKGDTLYATLTNYMKITGKKL